MKIIKHGRLVEPRYVTYTFHCAGCGCQFECERAEVGIKFDERENKNFATTDCPECSQAVWSAL